MSKLAANLSSILERINAASLIRLQSLSYCKPRLVAVSKLKSISDIIELYNAGQMNFGENYIKELEEKSRSDAILKNCPKIKWHFIGNLQTNKITKLANIPNLYMVETIDSLEAAQKLDNVWSKSSQKRQPLKIMIQVNTSGENQKSGIKPDKAVGLFKDIREKCLSLDLVGLMTIGSFDVSMNQNEPNQDFKTLVDCKKDLVGKLGLDEKSIELSMGMSHDFEQAIKMGSGSVRIGTLIFGERNK